MKKPKAIRRGKDFLSYTSSSNQPQRDVGAEETTGGDAAGLFSMACLVCFPI